MRQTQGFLPCACCAFINSIERNEIMITVNNVGMNFSGQQLFKHVDLKFVPGN